MSEGEVRLAERYVRSDRIVGRSLAEEYLLVPLVSHGSQLESIFNLNSVGSFVWERLDGRHDGIAIVQDVILHFDVDTRRAERDYLRFLDQLRSIHAVEPFGEKHREHTSRKSRKSSGKGLNP